MSAVRLTLAVGVAVCAALAARVEPAAACSCALGDPRTALRQADAAFIGRLVEKREGSRGPIRSSADPATYVFRVEEAVKGVLGGTVEVISPTSGASCGIEARVGQQIGLFLDRRDGAWHSSLCQQVEPARLRAAGRPLPRPNGRGNAALLVGGRFGEMRTLALDARGRTLAYGRGAGETLQLAPCPGERRSVEVARVGRRVVLSVRALPSLRRLRERTLVLTGHVFPEALRCGDAAGRVVYVFAANGDFPERSRLLRVSPRNVVTVWRGTSPAASFGDRVAFVNAGRRGTQLLSVPLGGGRPRTLVQLPRYTGPIALSPDGRSAGAVAYSAPLRRDSPPSRAVLVRLRPRARAESAPLGGSNVTGDVVWVAAGRMAVFPTGDTDVVRVYDTRRRLRLVARGRDWHARDAVRSGDRVYGLGWGGRLVVSRLPGLQPRAVASLPSPTAYVLVAVPPPS